MSFHFELPDGGKVRALQDAGIVLLATATNLEEAKLAELPQLGDKNALRKIFASEKRT